MREKLDDAMQELGMEEASTWASNVWQRRRVPRHAAHHEHGGSISMLGIPPGETAIDWNQVIFKGLVIKGIYGRRCSRPGTRCRACSRAAWSSARHYHRLGVNDYRDGFEVMNSASREGDPGLGAL